MNRSAHLNEGAEQYVVPLVDEVGASLDLSQMLDVV